MDATPSSSDQIVIFRKADFMKRLCFIIGILVVSFVTGCTSTPNEPEQPKPNASAAPGAQVPDAPMKKGGGSIDG
jgi:hypothetical protein